jgi:hypothetical protein
MTPLERCRMTRMPMRRLDYVQEEPGDGTPGGRLGFHSGFLDDDDVASAGPTPDLQGRTRYCQSYGRRGTAT